jgi:hypothetical protein
VNPFALVISLCLKLENKMFLEYNNIFYGSVR